MAREGQVLSQTNTKPTWKVKAPTIAFCCFAPIPPQIFSSEAQTRPQSSLRIIRTQACISPSRFSWNFQVVSSNRKPLFPATVVAPQYEHSSKNLVKRNDPKPKDAIFEPLGGGETNWVSEVDELGKSPRRADSNSRQTDKFPFYSTRPTSRSLGPSHRGLELCDMGIRGATRKEIGLPDVFGEASAAHTKHHCCLDLLRSSAHLRFPLSVRRRRLWGTSVSSTQLQSNGAAVD